MHRGRRRDDPDGAARHTHEPSVEGREQIVGPRLNSGQRLKLVKEARYPPGSKRIYGTNPIGAYHERHRARGLTAIEAKPGPPGYWACNSIGGGDL
jgi:hypothetical protein